MIIESGSDLLLNLAIEENASVIRVFTNDRKKYLEYNKQKTVYTDYYFRNRGCSNTNPSNPVDDKVIQQLKNSIKKETDRAKEAESKIVQDTANKYQAKEVGKGLSTNDYTNTEKQKLASLPDDFEPCTDAEINAMFKDLGL